LRNAWIYIDRQVLRYWIMFIHWNSNFSTFNIQIWEFDATCKSWGVCAYYEYKYDDISWHSFREMLDYILIVMFLQYWIMVIYLNSNLSTYNEHICKFLPACESRGVCAYSEDKYVHSLSPPNMRHSLKYLLYFSKSTCSIHDLTRAL
jgi:hypothetical protein